MQFYTCKHKGFPNKLMVCLAVFSVGFATYAHSQEQAKDSDIVQKSAPVFTLEQVLRGNVAGVRVTESDGAPGATFDVLVRGINFIKGSNQPLYVLDGVILNPAQLDNRQAYWHDPTDYQMLQNSLQAINPLDIKSIQVLKDAASTAMYGNVGANGVVVITTKNGTSIKPQVFVSSSVSFASMTRPIDMLDKQGYLDYMETKGNLVNSDGTPVDWQDELSRTAVSHNQFASVSGKSKNNAAYYISAGYSNQTGVIDRTGAQRTTLRINLDTPLGRFGKLGTRTLFSYNRIDMTSGVNDFDQSTVIRQMTLAAPFRFNGDLSSPDALMEDPQAMLNDYDDRSYEFRVIPMVYAEAKVLPWLSLRSQIGLDYRDNKRERWTGPASMKGDSLSGMVGRSDMFGFRYNWDNSINADWKSGRHAITGKVGFSINGDWFANRISEGYNLPTVAYILRSAGIMSSQNRFLANYQPYSFIDYSLLGQVAYTYNGKYTVNVSSRMEQYATYSNDWDNYPAVSASWNIAREQFMQNVKFVSGLKLRAGWGSSGIAQSNPYYHFFPFGTIFSPDMNATINEDPINRPVVSYDNYWHGRVSEVNVGLDGSLLKDRIHFSVDYFSRRSMEYYDIIWTGSRIATDTFSRAHLGVDSLAWRSPSKLKNHGFEASVDAVAFQNRDWKWTVGGNFFLNRSKIVEANGDQSVYYGNPVGTLRGEAISATMFENGKAPGLFYGLRSSGLLSNTTFITAPSYYGTMVGPGNIRFLDLNKDGDVNDADRTDIGDPNPLFSYGFNTSLAWKRFTLSMAFYGSYGNDVLNLNLINQLNTGDNSLSNVRKKAFIDSWTPDNTSTKYAAAGSLGMYDISRYIVEDGSFLRCSDITLSYDFTFGPKASKWISALRVSAGVKNAFIITPYSGYDPEVNSFAGDITRQGIDSGSYPAARSFVLGVSATF